MPRTIKTLPELLDLPEGAVILDSAGDVAQLRGGLWCAYETAPMTLGRMAKYLPAKLLHTPKEAR